MSKHKFLFKHSLPYTNFTDKTSDDEEPTSSKLASPSASQNPEETTSIIIWNQSKSSVSQQDQDKIISDSNYVPEEQNELDDISRISPLQPTRTYPGIEDYFCIDASASILTSLTSHESVEDLEDSLHTQSQPVMQQDEEIQQQYSYVPFHDDTGITPTDQLVYHNVISHDNSSESKLCTQQQAQLYPVIVCSQQSVLFQEQRRSPDHYIPHIISSPNISTTSCATSVIKSTHRVGVITRCPDRSTIIPVSDPVSQQPQPQFEVEQTPSPKTLNEEDEESPVLNISSANKNIIILQGNPKYECKVCQKKFQSKNNFKYHIHDPTATKYRHICKICNRGFIASTHYKYHLLTHSGERPYKCTQPECTKAFLTAKKLARHMLVHSGNKAHKCNLCPRAFHHRKELEHHQLVHNGEETFCCNICPKKFTVKSQLTIHASTHNGQEKFPCTLCNKRFVRNKHLQNHLLTHTDEKNFKCDKCTKCFRTEVSLTHHLKTHSTERPFTCECGRGFILHKDLTRHRNVHLAMAPFSCSESQCGKKFRRRDNLARHIKMHHGKS